jgi:tRNA U34 2-thiouridine synthase MnmA/TrmU
MVKALSLFSGGLDSILAARVVMAQGVEVEAIQFVTPFFNYQLLENIPQHVESMRQKYGVEVHVEDISPGYLQLLHSPRHGFGKNFNPCIDCKILMLKRAKELMAERGASFLVSGEVLGQRPMSQRRDTLNIIERDSGTRSILLRPLCAQLMTETLPEINGWVDRTKLLRMSGRGRSEQIALARSMGITDYPAPAGGCALTDPTLGMRVEQLYSAKFLQSGSEITVDDVRSLLLGRQFLLPGGGWLVVGRDEKENCRLSALSSKGDITLNEEDWPGPLGVLRKAGSIYTSEELLAAALARAAGVVARYGKKGPELRQANVTCKGENLHQVLTVSPLSAETCAEWNIQ